MKKTRTSPGFFGRLCASAAIACSCMAFCPSNQLYAESLMRLEQMVQDQKVTLNFRNRPVKDVLEEIKKQTGIGYAISSEIEKAIGRVTVNVKDKSVSEALETIFAGTDYTYRTVNNQIIVAERPAQKGRITVSGTILDNFKDPLPGAVVFVKGTTKGVETDLDGKFTLVLDKPGTIEVSYMGMQSVTREINRDNRNLTIELAADNTLDEVVVTGIFNKNKETFTGSVTTISEKELINFKGQNLVATLKNIDPVLNVSINNSLGSDPNALPDLSIRGNSSLPMSVEELNQGASAQLNTPLIIMDGFEISLQKLMDYNDEDIESMNILKDASATAIYGSRGANGVIVITTKAPQPGKIKVYFKAGMNLEMPDLTSYNLMNAREKLELENYIGLYNDENNAENDMDLQQKYFNTLREVNSGVDTYWIGQPVRTGVGQKYNLNVTGGSQEFRWGVSLAYNYIAGAMKGSDRTNFNGTINLSYNYKNLMFKNQTMLTTNKAANSNYGSFSEYARMNPYWRINDEDGNLIKTYYTVGGSPVGNPLYNSTLNTYDISKYTELVNNFSIEWNIIDELRLRGQIGISKQFSTSDAFYPAEHTKFQDYTAGEANKKGEYNYSTGESLSLDANVTLSYAKTVADKHNFYIGGDFYASERSGFDYYFSAVGFPNADLDFISSALGYPEGGKPSGTESKTRAVGFTVNANYSFDNKYFVDGSFRTDGSSQFGGNNRFAPFWSAGLGWNIHRENFMANQHLISNLKLRASIGESGSQNFSAYQALSMYEYYTSDRYGIWNGAYLMSHGNPNLKWQKVLQTNIGLDLSMLDGRISASVDVYQKNTTDLLSQRDIQASTGFTSYIENVGEIRNRGIEGMLSGYIIRNLEQEFTWSVTAKIAYNENKIMKLSDALKKQTAEAMADDVEINNLMFEGDPTNAIYAVRSLGIDPSTGNEIFLDRNGYITKTWSAGDKVYMGTMDPKYRGNISSLIQYKGLSVNLAFGYQFGGYQYNNTLLDKVEVTSGTISYGNVDRRVYSERWQKPGDVKFFKGIDASTTKATSRFVMPENTFELQNVSVQYVFDGKALKEKARIQNIILGVNMSDVFYVSTIKRERGTTYPFARHATLSVSLTF